MGNENADAQNNQKCCNSFKHRGILRNRSLSDRPCCTVKEIPWSGMNFHPDDDFGQQDRRMVEIGLKVKRI